MKKKWKLVIVIVVSLIIIAGVVIIWEMENQAQRHAEISRSTFELQRELESIEPSIFLSSNM